MNVKIINKYIADLKEASQMGYRFHENGPVTILSTDFAIMLNFLINNLNDYDKHNLSNYLLRQQNENGLFIDQDFTLADTSGSHKEDYINWQFTYFTTIALDMLGYKPKYLFKFLEPFLNKEKLRKWFDCLNWKNFWYSSNQIMFLMYFLTYSKEKMENNIFYSNNIIQECFDILDSKQDPISGYWGIESKSDLERGMYGAAHIFLFYDYYQRRINYKDKIIDNTLNMQNKNGLFGSKYGGACEDYDAIEVLSKVSKQTNYRKQDIHNAFLIIYSKIESSQSKNGGFSYSLVEDSLIEKIKLLRLKKNKRIYYYSGWKKMSSDIFFPDIWATYFRILTLAIIETDLKKETKNIFNFYQFPGWGYYSNKY